MPIPAKQKFIVDAERALIEIRGADGAPDAIYGDDFLVHQSFLVLEKSHTALEQLLLRHYGDEGSADVEAPTAS